MTINSKGKNEFVCWSEREKQHSSVAISSETTFACTCREPSEASPMSHRGRRIPYPINHSGPLFFTQKRTFASNSEHNPVRRLPHPCSAQRRRKWRECGKSERRAPGRVADRQIKTRNEVGSAGKTTKSTAHPGRRETGRGAGARSVFPLA